MQVVALNKIILNIFRNYVPNKYITIDDKVPVWKLKQKIKAKMHSTKNMFRMVDLKVTSFISKT